MLFNSFEFVYFFVAFFILYWFVTKKDLKLQNLLLLVAGYIFYAWSDWRFLSYLIGISALNYFLGIYIEKTLNPKHKQWLLYVGLVQGIGGLAFFKYFNFFITSFKDAFHLIGINVNTLSLNIALPLGISFFTFRTISYVLDVHNAKIKATKDWVVFFTYVSFFPSILSGPIDRAKNLIPQLENKRELDYYKGIDGFFLIIWGLFKKLVIADNCAVITNAVFKSYLELPSSTLILGSFLYTIQLYADFSGYSDMAIGISRLMGFSISKNFDFPFFAQNIAEFWRKWHISLTLWMTDYVFTPLSIAFRDYANWGLSAAIILNFTIIGIWHGANWTYVLFGFLHGCFFIPLILKGTLNKKKKLANDEMLPSLREFLNMLGTFTLVMMSLIIFRSESIPNAIGYLNRIFSTSILSIPKFRGEENTTAIISLFFIAIFIMVEWKYRFNDFVFNGISQRGISIQLFNIIFIVLALYFFSGSMKSYIYFNF